VVSIPPSKDNTLYEDLLNEPPLPLSNGGGEELFSGDTSDKGLRRAVIAFDVAGSLPPGSTIDAVTLTLNMNRSQRAGAETFTLHRLQADWGEGTVVAPGQEGGGGSADTGDATWLDSFYPSTPWATPGGDFSGTASDSLLVDRKGFYTWGSTPGMVADVQSWLDSPSSDFGWILIGNEGAIETAKRFGSRENGTTENRPVLEVEFTAGALTGACCAADGICSIRVPRAAAPIRDPTPSASRIPARPRSEPAVCPPRTPSASRWTRRAVADRAGPLRVR
jgi:hypothetical protein